MTTSECIRQSRSLGIDEIVEYLVEQGVFESGMVETRIILLRRLLIFAVLGWQSMLYLPSFDTCPLDELAVHQDIDQPDSGLVFHTYKMSSDLADRPMSILLKGYGNILPSRSEELTKVASESNASTSSWFCIDPAEANAHLLHTLLRVNFRWVDTMALHLDYDSSTRTLSLFRYPSLCAAMLQSEGTLYGFASTELSSSDPRANHNEITNILHETLLSYRLLFGQSKPSRLLFRRVLRCSSILSNDADPFLNALCSENFFSHPLVPQDRFVYFVHRDFPVLGGRVKRLGDELKGARPKNWKDLLRDRRDTTQYWTFWLVAIIGGASIVLSLVQVILQVVALKKPD